MCKAEKKFHLIFAAQFYPTSVDSVKLIITLQAPSELPRWYRFYCRTEKRAQKW